MIAWVNYFSPVAALCAEKMGTGRRSLRSTPLSWIPTLRKGEQAWGGCLLCSPLSPQAGGSNRLIIPPGSFRRWWALHHLLEGLAHVGKWVTLEDNRAEVLVCFWEVNWAPPLISSTAVLDWSVLQSPCCLEEWSQKGRESSRPRSSAPCSGNIECSCGRLSVTPWSVAPQAPLSMGFSWQKCWSGLPCPPSGDLPHPGLEPESPKSPALAGRFFTTSATWEAQNNKWRTNSSLPLSLLHTPFSPSWPSASSRNISHVILLLENLSSLSLLIQHNPSCPIGPLLSFRAWPQIILSFSLWHFTHMDAFEPLDPSPGSRTL